MTERLYRGCGEDDLSPVMERLLSRPAAKPGVVIPGAFQGAKRGAMPGASPSAEAPTSPHGSAKRRPSRSATKVGE